MKRTLLMLNPAILLGISGPTHLNADPTRIHLANDDHTDYMWTADAETYNAVFVDMLDYHLGLADDTKDNPPPYRSRFNADGSYWLWNYEHHKSPKDFDRLMGRVKTAHISTPLSTYQHPAQYAGLL